MPEKNRYGAMYPERALLMVYDGGDDERKRYRANGETEEMMLGKCLRQRMIGMSDTFNGMGALAIRINPGPTEQGRAGQ